MAPDGLSSSEVRQRISEGKVNKYESPVSRGYIDIIVKNLFTAFNMVLLILGGALIYFGEYTNALAATGVILMNVMISTIQEIRAKRRLDKIALLLRPVVVVRRDGAEVTVDPSEIVMDDVVHMTSGDQAQVDGEIIECKSFEMDESLLTGESSTRRKKAGDTIYSGAFCVTGDCYYRVTALGEDTFATKMLVSAKKFKKKKTPLQMETSSVTEFLMALAFFYLALMVILNIVGGKPAIDSLIESVIILDIVPIALFLLITITYMIAAVRMANSGVLLQNSNSVESMSHVDTVCMDKTGTITTNNLVFESVEYFCDPAAGAEIIKVFSTCTGSRNRTVKALEAEFGRVEAQLVEEVQFSSDRKYSAVRARYGGGEITAVMGAYSVLKNRIESSIDIDSKISSAASKGLRTVLMCRAETPELFRGEDEVESKLVPVALVLIKDEVRPDCKEIISKFIDNGMDIKVISGDDPETVNAMFTIAGIPGERRIISGDALASMGENEKKEAVLATNIFGRMKPDQKEDVIKILKDSGRYVAMVGDGVNDVKSLKMANVGVAMQSGSGATRGVADMVLLNDQFSALPKAMVEGKRTVSGMRDILKIYLARNFILAIIIGVMLLGLDTLPILPIQNTYYALSTVSIAAFLIAIWAKPSENKGLILPDVLRFCLPMALLISVFAIVIFYSFMVLSFEGTLNIPWEPVFSVYQSVFPGNTVDQFFEHMTGISGAPADLWYYVVARNAMLFFLVAAGISMIALVFPRYKWMTRGEAHKGMFPTLLILMLIGVVVLFHNVPVVYMGLASVMVFPAEIYLILFAILAVWMLCAIAINRSKRESIIVRISGRFFNKRYANIVRKEDEKDQRR